ncbi:hypothetical protein C6503_02500 [Candidatus Poribacteria bacterium]|nr:MAG: hypothetical protein C6503_02500 [Candidatus Poribacteria bacterium]
MASDEKIGIRIGIFTICGGTFIVICIVCITTLLKSCGYTEIESAKVSEHNKLKEDLAHLVKQNMNDPEITTLKVEVKNLKKKLTQVERDYAPYHAALENKQKAERAERAAKAKAEALKRDAKAKLDEDFKLQFSMWNGSHRNTVEYVKERMHNPKSFKHVETRYVDYIEKGFRIIQMKYQGTNLFNAVVTNSIWVKVDLGGNVMEVMKNQ